MYESDEEPKSLQKRKGDEKVAKSPISKPVDVEGDEDEDKNEGGEGKGDTMDLEAPPSPDLSSKPRVDKKRNRDEENEPVEEKVKDKKPKKDEKKREEEEQKKPLLPAVDSATKPKKTCGSLALYSSRHLQTPLLVCQLIPAHWSLLLLIVTLSTSL